MPVIIKSANSESFLLRNTKNILRNTKNIYYNTKLLKNLNEKQNA